MKPTTFKHWSGMDSLRADVELVGIEGVYPLRNAVNVDFTNAGKPISRPGYSLLRGGAASSGFAFGPYLIYLRDGRLEALHTGTLAVTDLAAAQGDRLGHVIIDGNAYIADGLSKWLLQPDLTVGQWPTVPADDPTFDPRFTADFPACTKLAVWRGRLVGALGKLVMFSHPYVYGSFDPTRNYFYVADAVAVLYANSDTLFVGGRSIQALAEIDGGLTTLLAVPSIDAEPVVDPLSGAAYWLTESGPVSVGASGGEVTPLALAVLPRPALRAALGLSKRDGATQLIVSLQPDSSVAEQHPLTSADYLRSEVMRKEIFDAL